MNSMELAREQKQTDTQAKIDRSICIVGCTVSAADKVETTGELANQWKCQWRNIWAEIISILSVYNLLCILIPCAQLIIWDKQINVIVFIVYKSYDTALTCLNESKQQSMINSCLTQLKVEIQAVFIKHLRSADLFLF